MRWGLWALATVFVAVFAAHFLLQDKGYVLINFRTYVVEMSVPALLLILIIGYALVRGVLKLWDAPRKLGAAVAERRVRRAGVKLTRGLIHMTEGDWGRGERLLTEGLKGSDAPLVNYLMAARAAQLQGSAERRNEWLKLAYEELPEAANAVLLTQAELQFESGEFERALATLQGLKEADADHPVGLALLAQTYQALGDREHLVELLPRLARARLQPDTLVQLAAEAFEAVLGLEDLTHERLTKLWSELPTQLRKVSQLIRLHALALNRLGHGEQAERELRAALKRNWQAEIVQTYGEVKGDDPVKQLRQAESWLKLHPEDGTLLLATARLCMANELWGKARSYLESSLALAPNPESYALYGRLLNKLGERENAALAYHSGLSLVSGGDFDLPALDAPADTGADD